MNKRDEKMLKKMLDLIKASTAEEPSVCHYHCPDCGTLMEWEDEMEDGMVCPVCGHSSSLPEFGFDGDLDEWESSHEITWDEDEVDPDDPDWDKDLWDND